MFQANVYRLFKSICNQPKQKGLKVNLERQQQINILTSIPAYIVLRFMPNKAIKPDVKVYKDNLNCAIGKAIIFKTTRFRNHGRKKNIIDFIFQQQKWAVTVVIN